MRHPGLMRRPGGVFVALVGFLTIVACGIAEAGYEKAPQGVRFYYRDAGAGSVSLAGEFNGWNVGSNPLTRDDSGLWSAVVALPPGEHPYKFVVDGQWMPDPDNPVTQGDYGNSLIRIGADGTPAAAPSAPNTPLSGRVFLGSRYIALFQGRRDETLNPEWDFRRPAFDIDLDFQVQVTEQLRARILTNINNENQNVQLWETNLRFDRGNLTLLSEPLNFVVFDNDSVGHWNDPLRLVGNVGIYGHSWGYDQQGILAWRRWGRVEARLLYSDNFRTGGTSAPNLDALLNGEIDELAVTPDEQEVRAYSISETDNNKDVLAGRAEAVLGRGFTGGLSFRSDRGANPGVYVALRADTSNGVSLTGARYGNTVENWMAGGVDLRFFDDPLGFEAFGEVLYGEARVSGNRGDSLQVTLTQVSPESVQVAIQNTGAAESLDGRIDESLRFTLGGHYFAFRGWHWKGSVEYQDHGLVSGPGFLDERTNRLLTFRAGLGFSGPEWKAWPWSASLDMEVFDFDYESDAWEDQIWFDTRNFWLEDGEHLVTFDKLVMLGGNDVLSWKPRASWTFFRPRNATLSYRGIVNTTAVHRKPKYWEQVLGFHVDVSRRLGLNMDSRWVRYDDPVLNLEDTFLSHFVELKYTFSSAIEVALSWGVDPWVIDAPVNEYAYIGRDQFLFSRGANGEAARATFLDLGETIQKAEEALEDEKRIQIEGILRF